MIRLSALLIIMGSAVSAGYCDDLLALTTQDTPQLALPDGSDQVSCSQSLALGGRQHLHCSWPFTYRDTAASDAFLAGVAALERCFGAATHHQNVNHPDTYNLQIFTAGDQEIGLSLKDKAALNQTYLFLRITWPDGGSR